MWGVNDELYNFTYTRIFVELDPLQAPQPFGSWNGVRDCVDEPPVCLQWSKDANGTIGSEDCLYINVYTPLASNLPLYSLEIYQ